MSYKVDIMIYCPLNLYDIDSFTILGGNNKEKLVKTNNYVIPNWTWSSAVCFRYEIHQIEVHEIRSDGIYLVCKDVLWYQFDHLIKMRYVITLKSTI
mgnify:CR=1 FL=1